MVESEIKNTLLVTSELLFELYSAPRLTYCVDGIMSFYQNNTPRSSSPFNSDGIVVSMNTASTSVIPILHGKGVLSNSKRWGDHVIAGRELIVPPEYLGEAPKYQNICSNLCNSNTLTSLLDSLHYRQQ